MMLRASLRDVPYSADSVGRCDARADEAAEGRFPPPSHSSPGGGCSVSEESPGESPSVSAVMMRSRLTRDWRRPARVVAIGWR